MRWWLAGLGVAIAAIRVLLGSGDQDLPTRGDFIRGGCLIVALAGIAVMLAATWRRFRRMSKATRGADFHELMNQAEQDQSLPPPTEEPRPESPPPAKRFIRRVIWEAVSYVLALGLASIAFAIYLEQNPTPDWLSPKVIQEAYSEQIQLMEHMVPDGRSTVSNAVVYSMRPEVEASFAACPELLHANITAKTTGRGVAVYARPGYGYRSQYSGGMPYDSDGNVPPLMIGESHLDDGNVIKIVWYRWEVDASDGTSFECTLEFDYELLKQRLTATAEGAPPISTRWERTCRH